MNMPGKTSRTTVTTSSIAPLKWSRKTTLQYQDESAVTSKLGRPLSYRMSSLNTTLRKRNLDELPMDHTCADAARMSARRRQEKDVHRSRIAMTRSESQQLSSYSRKRFDTALSISGKSLPPPTPEDKRIFWDEVQPTWTHQRHHSVTVPISVTPSFHHRTARPGSHPHGTVVAFSRQADNGFDFNHMRGNNDMYPMIKRLIQDSNAEYRVICHGGDHDQVDTNPRRRPCIYTSGRRSSVDKYVRRASMERPGSHPSTDHSVITDCYLVPLKENPPPPAHCHREDVKVQQEPVLQLRHEHQRSDEEDSVDEFAERLGDVTSLEEGKRQADTQKTDDEEEEEEEQPSSPWRCWVDDATVSSIGADPETETPGDDLTAEASSLAPDTAAETSAPPSGVDLTSKTKLNSQGKLAKSSTVSLDKRDSAANLAPEALNPTPDISATNATKRKSSARLKKRKGKKGTPEPAPVEVVELPPPPPPTPPVVEDVDELVEEVEVEPVLPSFICPSSIGKSTDVEIKLWLRKCTFSSASRTLPIF